MEQFTNARGNFVRTFNEQGIDRYTFDFNLCSHADGWKQYDTDQDAWYFGVWVHPDRKRVVTYCEGDVSIVDCPTEESFAAELASMAEFYGEPPPAFTVIDNDGSVTHIYDERPT